MHDRPTALELLEAVRHFLESDVVPALDGTKKFHARVAANVLAIVSREMQTEPQQLRGEWRRLAELLDDLGAEPIDPPALKPAIRAATERLCEQIRTGAFDNGPAYAAVVAHVRQTVIDKLAVANPKFLASDDKEIA